MGASATKETTNPYGPQDVPKDSAGQMPGAPGGASGNGEAGLPGAGEQSGSGGVPAGSKGAAAAKQGGVGWAIKNLLIPCLILLGGGGVMLAFGVSEPPTRSGGVPDLAARLEALPEVKTLPVRSLASVGGTLDMRVDGVVVPYREVQLATQVAGEIVYKDPACEVGSYVEQGQLLIRIEDTDYQNEIERLTKQKAQDYQAIREVDQEMANTNRLIELAEQDVALRDRELARLKTLDRGFTSPGEIDSAERARLQAVNAKVTLENQLDSLRQRRTRLESVESSVETQLEMARTNLQRTEIRAPVTGVIFREDVEVNSFVQRGEAVVTIEDTSKAEIVVNLRPSELYWVLNQPMEDRPLAAQVNPEVSGDSAVQDAAAPRTDSSRSYRLPKTEALVRYQISGRETELLQWRGTLDSYDGIGVDATSRTVPVRIVVDTPRARQVVDQTGAPLDVQSGPLALVRGMFVQVVLQINPQRELLVLPGVALKPGNNGNRVWKFRPDATALDLTEEQKKAIELAQKTVLQPGSPEPTESPEQLDAEEAKEPARQALDPEDWLVGKIDVIAPIRPIESARLNSDEPADGPLAADTIGRATYWICEVADGSLQPGDMLVVSPLPAFQGNGDDVVRLLKPEAATPNRD
ncbi:efflux RND transporter periplasmic adaptor subunit [Planctomycetaceae bacterium SH139]